ncbi:RNase P and RNase MRP subunit [Schizosaccharomyces japonicus yFS275]|uniref:Ribonuclease P/MRP protein subunit POP5 n=1 Tax=Schizosaccharomyces japonicus (strain yFS275 / FY16936) TaxID=402676 RepID=B6K530_SCHJY|nr:RNase P and RNase MRP subunit [Schizosaccharomyces japonicus yFS275]EEB08634.1 RNase P and RNase MRP subunit [Schizosaccharomyces japonicus yFS275]
MVRFKSRYLLFEILYPEHKQFHEIPAVPSGNQLTSSLLSKQIRAAVHENFGDHGLGSVQSNLSIKYFSPRTSTGILRVARQHYRIAWAALTLIHELLGQKVVIRVVRTAGTIKRAEMAAIERNASDIRLLSIHDEVEEI